MPPIPPKTSRQAADGGPIIAWLPSCPTAMVATMSSVGFGLSPATGHAIRDLIDDGACSFADTSSFALSRFGRLEPDWVMRQGWHGVDSAA
ncbi:hypothetical protein [Pseudoroseicyclus tamaricis]|uniref:hypothetical protein n=1 Tax=Pseudoroseicyclus tamaricis TaxID=2705421 RepID=UPI00193F6BB0|nr:hypothetical protein [Pseudoroseicyclus tamaricis]